jgi:hypothetical protein
MRSANARYSADPVDTECHIATLLSVIGTRMFVRKQWVKIFGRLRCL